MRLIIDIKSRKIEFLGIVPLTNSIRIYNRMIEVRSKYSLYRIKILFLKLLFIFRKKFLI